MTPSKQIDVTELMRQIRDRVRQKGLDEISVERPGLATATVPILDNLRTSLSELRASVDRLADLPPQPPTLRGTVGAAFSQVVRRMLFWQYLQARSFQTSTASALEHVATGLQTAFTNVSRLSSQVDRFERTLHTAPTQLQELSGRTQEVETALSNTANAIQQLLKRQEDLSNRSDALEAELERLEEELKKRDEQDRFVLGRMESISGELSGLRQQLQDLAERHSQESATVGEKINLIDRHAIHTRRRVMLQDQRITNLLRSVRKSPDPDAPGGREEPVPAEDDEMAGLYLDLEDAFRGSPDEIARRVSEYLPILKESGVQPGAGFVVDIGCGRGEWLQVLSQNGYSSKGCDSNHSMVAVCQELSLDVVRQDGLDFLRSLPENSASAVTAFHVIEHLPLEQMLALIDGSLRALRPGGVIILETPNPQNVLVGCHNFHIDPTHRKPIPMPLLQFLVEARGFCDVRPLALHPYPESMLLAAESEVAKRFNEYFYGPQDYAIIAKKA